MANISHNPITGKMVANISIVLDAIAEESALKELSIAVREAVAKDETIREKIRIAVADAVANFDREIVFAGVKAIAAEQLNKK